jgi:hypothetical protein
VFSITAAPAAQSCRRRRRRLVRLKHLARGAADHADFVRIAFGECEREVLGLLQCDVGRQRRHFGIGLDLQHYWNVAGKSLLPGRPELVRVVDIDAAQADHFREAMVGHVRNALRRFELRIAFNDPLLPRHLIEIFVVKDADDPAMVLPLAPVFRYRNEFGHVVHLHRAVADQRDNRAIRLRVFGGDGVGHSRPHRRQAAR